MTLEKVRKYLTAFISKLAERRFMQKALQSSEQRHRIASEQTGQIVYDWDVQSGTIAWAGAIEEITGYGDEEFQKTNITLWEQMIHPHDRADAMELLDAAAKSNGKYSVEYRLKKRDGSYAYVEDNGVFLKNDQGVASRMVGTMKDVSERRQADELRRLNESRQAAQIKLNQMFDKSEAEIIRFAMDEAVRLTESEIGYIAFLNEDETELAVQIWSDSAMRECKIQDKPSLFAVNSTGLWGEAIRQRRAIIINDYGADSPLKKGTPEGHVPIKRHLNAPIFDGHHIAIVAGLGNKPLDYDESDVRQLTLLMSGLWSIIQRKRAESNLAASEHLYRAIFETANDAIFLMTGETFVDCNSKTLDIFGCRRDQIIGQPPYRFSPEKQPDGHLSSDKAVEKIESALAGAPQFFEWLHSRYDGTPFEAEVSLNRFEVPGALMILAVVRDITERRKAERELERTRELLHAAVAQSPTGIVIASAPDGKIEYANLSALGDQETTDFLRGKTLVSDLSRGVPLFLSDGVTPVPMEQLPLSRALREGVISRNIEIIARNEAIGDRWLSINAAPIRDREEKVIAGVAIINDITEVKRADREQRQLKDKLQRAQRMESLGILAGGVAHDLNNMLGPVVGYSELLVRQLESDPKLAARAGKIMKSAQDAAEIIQDLLTLARRGRYEMSPLSLNDVINSFVESPACMSVRERHPNVSIEIDLTDAPTTIRGSDPHLAKVIMNLVSNASEAMTDGGTLSIQTELRNIRELLSGFAMIEPGNYVLLRVKDSGVGIAPEDLTKIFEPYYSKKKMGQSGTGLGLSIVYGVVKDHGGYYDVFSQPGDGTEFVLYFPVCTDLSNVTHQSHPVSGGTERILIVDDAPEQRDLASEILSGLGYQVATVDSGRLAVKYLATQSVDLILLDMIMEADFDGLDTAREIFGLYPHQKIIVVSGFSATERVQEMHKLGVGPYVRKPYTVDNLSRIVRMALNQTPSTTESQSTLLT